MKKRAVLLIVTLVLINCSLLQANPADINKDGRVNSLDLAMFCNSWLWTVQPDGMEWVYINDPVFVFHEGFVGEMSKFEITNAQYCQFLNAALASYDVYEVSSDKVYGSIGYNAGTDYVDKLYYRLDGAHVPEQGEARINYNFLDDTFNVDPNFEDHPVTYVSWYGAKAFCNYYLYRLPTEWEWQAVADYDGTYTYGCGYNISTVLANYDDSDHPYGTKSVGSYSSFGWGMYDMAGNVWEWTDNCEYEDCEPIDDRIMRGGGWDAIEDDCMVWSIWSKSPELCWISIGFRVCR